MFIFASRTAFLNIVTDLFVNKQRTSLHLPIFRCFLFFFNIYTLVYNVYTPFLFSFFFLQNCQKISKVNTNALQTTSRDGIERLDRKNLQPSILISSLYVPKYINYRSTSQKYE